MERFSVSKLNLFLVCPRSYFYKYILNITSPGSTAMFFGSAIHEGIAAFYKGGNPVQAFKDELKKINPVAGIVKDDKEYKALLKQGVRLMELYQTDAPYFEPEAVEELREVYLTHPATDEKLPIPFVFKIDLLTKDGYIVDHKTTSGAGKRQSETDRIQGIAYTMAYRTMYGERPKGFIQNALVKRVKKPEIIPTIFQYTPDDEAWFFQVAEKVIGMVRRKEYLIALPMIRTFYPCPYKNICEIHGGK